MNNCSVHASIFLALHYAWREYPSERETKRHLRIPANAGNPHAQDVFRKLFEKWTCVPREAKLVERRDGKTQKDRNRSRKKNAEKSNED